MANLLNAIDRAFRSLDEKPTANDWLGDLKRAAERVNWNNRDVYTPTALLGNPTQPWKLPLVRSTAVEAPAELRATLRRLWLVNSRMLRVHDGELSPEAAAQAYQRARAAFLDNPTTCEPPPENNRAMLFEYTQRRKALLRGYFWDHGVEHLEAHAEGTRLVIAKLIECVKRVRKAEVEMAGEFCLPEPTPGDVCRSILRTLGQWESKLGQTLALLETRRAEISREFGRSVHLTIDGELMDALGVEPPTESEIAEEKPSNRKKSHD